MRTVAVVDYGMSNLRSVAKALEYVAEGNWQVTVCADPAEMLQADKIVFPGQGAIGDCMRHLKSTGFDAALWEAIQIRHKPFLGICLGLQSLMVESDEDGGVLGLGIYRGRVIRFPQAPRDPTTGELLKVPHMGWNQVEQRQSHPLWAGIENEARFYFVHSYHVVPAEADLIAGTTRYAVEFTSAIARDNVFATQFHPEKSQRAGLQLLRNFLCWTP